MTKSKKKVIIIAAVILLIIMLFPIKLHYKDGGSVEYKALIYSVWDYHSLDGLRGTEVRIFELTVIDNTYYIDESVG